MTDIDRRTYLKATAGTAAALGVAGCSGGSSSGTTTTTSGGTTTSSAGTTSNTTTTSSKPDSIVIGSDIPYKPFEYQTNSGDLTGFDVDMAHAIFEEQLNIKESFKSTSFDTIIPSLNGGNFRCIMSAMTITDQRAQKVDFTDPYFTAYQTVIVLKNSSISSKADLKGKTVGVQQGTTGADAADTLKSDFNGNLSIKSYGKIPAAFNALMNGQVDAVINDNTVNASFVNTHSDSVEFIQGNGAAAQENSSKAPPYLTLTVEHYGIAFRKGDPLVSDVNGALKQLHSSGKYDTIYGKYFQG